MPILRRYARRFFRAASCNFVDRISGGPSEDPRIHTQRHQLTIADFQATPRALCLSVSSALISDALSFGHTHLNAGELPAT